MASDLLGDVALFQGVLQQLLKAIPPASQAVRRVEENLAAAAIELQQQGIPLVSVGGVSAASHHLTAVRIAQDLYARIRNAVWDELGVDDYEIVETGPGQAVGGFKEFDPGIITSGNLPIFCQAIGFVAGLEIEELRTRIGQERSQTLGNLRAGKDAAQGSPLVLKADGTPSAPDAIAEAHDYVNRLCVSVAVLLDVSERLRERPGAEEKEPPGPADEMASANVEPGSQAPESVETRALQVLVAHSEWTVARIAEEIGCHAKSLAPSKAPRFAAARAAMKTPVRDLPKGSKSADGTLEAWEESEESGR